MTRISNIVFLVVIGAILLSCESIPQVPVDAELPEGIQLESYGSNSELMHAVKRDGENITIEGDLLGDLKQGAWTKYDPNEVPTEITTYHRGKKQGVSLTFDKQGYVSTKANYSAGLLHGEYKIYSRRKVVEERYYINDQLEGVVVKYYPTGKIMQEAPYEGGQMHGIAKWYDEQGNLSFAYKYDQGELVDQNPKLD